MASKRKGKGKVVEETENEEPEAGSNGGGGGDAKNCNHMFNAKAAMVQQTASKVSKEKGGKGGKGKGKAGKDPIPVWICLECSEVTYGSSAREEPGKHFNGKHCIAINMLNGQFRLVDSCRAPLPQINSVCRTQMLQMRSDADRERHRLGRQALQQAARLLRGAEESRRQEGEARQRRGQARRR